MWGGGISSLAAEPVSFSRSTVLHEVSKRCETHKAENRYVKKAGLSLCTLLKYMVEKLKLGI